MGVRKTEERNVRKLFKVGYQRSYAVVLPIEYVRKLGWRDGQNVLVDLKGQTLTIKDRP